AGRSLHGSARQAADSPPIAPWFATRQRNIAGSRPAGGISRSHGTVTGAQILRKAESPIAAPDIAPRLRTAPEIEAHCFAELCTALALQLQRGVKSKRIFSSGPIPAFWSSLVEKSPASDAKASTRDSPSRDAVKVRSDSPACGCDCSSKRANLATRI